MPDSPPQAGRRLKSHTGIIDLWPSLAVYASDIGVNYDAAKQQRRRSAIGSPHWNTVVAAAAARGIAGITLETLTALQPVKHPARAGRS